MNPAQGAESLELGGSGPAHSQQCHSRGRGKRPRGKIIITPSSPCIQMSNSVTATAFFTATQVHYS